MVQFLIILVMLGSLIGLLSGWRRDRKLLSEARKGSLDRGAERTTALEKANEDLKTAQAELQRRWQYLTKAQRLSHSGTFGWKVRSGELVWSDEPYRILGFTRETNPTLDLIFDRIHPEDLERARQLSDRAAQNGMDLDIEHRILLPNGVIKYCHAVAHNGRDSSGNLESMGVFADISERKRAEEERQALSRDLQESKARLKEAQRVAHIGHYYWDLIANRMTWSDELYRIYGLTPQEGPIDMAMVREMIHPDDREDVFRAAEEAVRSGLHTEAERRVVRPDGTVRTVHGVGTVKRDASGRAYERFGTAQDITDRKRAEEALRRSQLYLSEGQRLAHMGDWAAKDFGIRWSGDLGIYWSDEVSKFSALTRRTGPQTLNGIWLPSTLTTEPPWRNHQGDARTALWL
jgi:PAS domain S-box-containing protein